MSQTSLKRAPKDPLKQLEIFQLFILLCLKMSSAQTLATHNDKCLFFYRWCKSVRITHRHPAMWANPTDELL